MLMGEIIMYETAKQLFLEGKSLRSISDLTGVDRKKLSQMLKADGIEVKSRGLTRGKSKYNHNTEAFKIIDNEEKAYWLGFLYADGSVYEPRGTIELSLAHKDLEHLERFRDFISPDMEIKSRMVNGHLVHRLQIVSMEIVQDLIKQGCMPAKSLILQFPTMQQIPNKLLHHFMRGYFDGDGTAYWFHDPRDNSKPQANAEVIGSYDFIKAYQTILSHFGLPIREKFTRHGKAYGYRFGGNGLYKKFTDFLYKDATIYLERKLLL